MTSSGSSMSLELRAADRRAPAPRRAARPRRSGRAGTSARSRSCRRRTPDPRRRSVTASRRPCALGVLGPVDEPEQVALVERPEAVHLVDDPRGRRRSRSISRCASSKQRSSRWARMWNSRSPGVATRCGVAAAKPGNGCSPAGRGSPEQPVPQRPRRSRSTQLSSPSGIRNPTERLSPLTSASSSRTTVLAARRRRSATRKIAASVSLPSTGCGSGAIPPSLRITGPARASGRRPRWARLPVGGAVRVHHPDPAELELGDQAPWGFRRRAEHHSA